MSRSARWTLATAVVCVAVLAASWFLLVSPKRAEAAESRAAADQVVQDNRNLETTIRQLQMDFAALPARRDELAAIQAALPAEVELQDVLDEIDAAAVAAGVSLDSVTNAEAVALIQAAEPAPAATADPAAPPDAAAPAPAGLAVAAATPAPEATIGGSSPPATAPAPAPTAENGAAPATDPTQPVLAAVPVTINATGDYFAIAAFVKTLQTDIERALLMDGVSFDLVTAAAAASPAGGAPVPAPETSQVTAAVTGRVFVYVDPQAALVTGGAGTDAEGSDAAPTTTGEVR